MWHFENQIKVRTFSILGENKLYLQYYLLNECFFGQILINPDYIAYNSEETYAFNFNLMID